MVKEVIGIVRGLPPVLPLSTRDCRREQRQERSQKGDGRRGEGGEGGGRGYHLPLPPPLPFLLKSGSDIGLRWTPKA